jgi:hypothetical protein
MASKLFNVRLDDKRLRKARKLRESGRNLADVVREAIDTEYSRMAGPRGPADPAAIVTGILDRLPDPAGLPLRPYDVHDAQAARQAVTRGLRARQARQARQTTTRRGR